ncbi:hypothetical protein [Shewanella polaris]|uniref:Uncharacterized protein n=1 Tax=Shewanella polaris TaxID=2588449 RepID=A0A4Y5YGA8_9GAMM|nr:hypothetical protein [Shewanella polaris]QDE31832.1 hypothetical protein FH971_13205 [Shewanella polaris]
MSTLSAIEKSLKDHDLSDISGSPFDNAFEVFDNEKDDINLILLGTNGNMTDAIKNNIEWVRERAKNPTYSHLISGDWGQSPLRKELIKVPEILNEFFGFNKFSLSRMVLTNGLLLASEGVGDIKIKFNSLSRDTSKFIKIRDLVHSSMSFFNDYVIQNSSPEIIFAYGNSEQGHSAWKYLRSYYPEIKGKILIPIKSTSYKFCSLNINDREVFIIGSPHPCFHYNKLNKSLIKQGLKELGAI